MIESAFNSDSNVQSSDKEKDIMKNNKLYFIGFPIIIILLAGIGFIEGSLFKSSKTKNSNLQP